MPAVSQGQGATLHALTERLASHSRMNMNPFMGMAAAAGAGGPAGFPSPLSPQAMAAAASAYGRPAPPPQLPNCPVYTRHQDQGLADARKNEDGVVVGDGKLRCPHKRQWPGPNEHKRDERKLTDEQMTQFVEDMTIVMRREYDCWVEQCWTEAFHHMFTRSVPILLISLIMKELSPTFLRRKIVHGGPALDRMFQEHMVGKLHEELEERLTNPNRRPTPSSSTAAPAKPSLPMMPNMAGGNSGAPPVIEEGVCFHSLLYLHYPDMKDDDHGLCLCQLTACLECFTTYTKSRKGAYSLLPHELADSPVREGWGGGVETQAQAEARKQAILPKPTPSARIPEGRGFVKNPKAPSETNGHSASRPPPLFPHPQMTDVLAVEEHLRWRLKEMGGSDAAVEARYGPSTNDPAAMEGLGIGEDESEDGDNTAVNGTGTGAKTAQTPKSKMVKVAKGKGGKVRRVPNGTANGKKGAEKKCYLPKTWTEAEAQDRNMAIILTFRHFVKLLHQTAVAASPFTSPTYPEHIVELARIHPIGMYRRIAQLGRKRDDAPSSTLRLWSDCMDKWGEKFAEKEKKRGTELLVSKGLTESIEAYSRAISLDPKKSNTYMVRATAFNKNGQHAQAEEDCKLLLAKDAKNARAYVVRAQARRGLGRLREAKADVDQALKLDPGHTEALEMQRLLKPELAGLPKTTHTDALNNW